MEYITTPEQAEQNAAVRMRVLGYPDARVTTRGADAGIDVVATGAIAQVKWRAGQVGRPDVQRLYGARGNKADTEMFFFAAASYSSHATDYANDVGIALFTYNPIGEVVPVNYVARQLVQKVAATTPGRIVAAPKSQFVQPDDENALLRTQRRHHIEWAIFLAVMSVGFVIGGIASLFDETHPSTDSRIVGLVAGLAFAALFAGASYVKFLRYKDFWHDLHENSK